MPSLAEDRGQEPDTRTLLFRIAPALPVFLALGLGTTALGAASPRLRSEMGSDSSIGDWTVSLYNFAALLSILLGASHRDRLAGRSPVRTCLVLFVLGEFAMSAVLSWEQFCCATAVAGAGYGGLVLRLNTIVAERSVGRGFLALNLVNAVFGAGAVLGPALVGCAGFWCGTAFLSAGVLALSGYGIHRWQEHPVPPSEADGPLWRTPREGNGDRPRPRYPLQFLHPFRFLSPGMIVLGFLYAGAETGVGAWESTHLHHRGYDPSQAAQLVTLFWAGLCVGRFVLPWMLRGLDTPTIVRSCLTCAAVSLGCATFLSALPWAYAAAGVSLGPVLPGLLDWIARTSRNTRSSTAYLFASSTAGSCALPMLVASVTHRTSAAGIPLTLALITTLAAVVSVVLCSSDPAFSARRAG
ncbi:MAG: hypothetical protein QG608_1955 [Actinomycetota bacterium]|nr:hypothetical protein [Actinomycetota bacterium]